MKNVAILVPESSVLQAIADPQYCFSAVNQFLALSGRKPLFNVQLVGAKKEVKLNDGRYSVHTDKLLKEVKKTDLVFIPALFGDMAGAVKANKALAPWIVDQYKKGAEVASLCVGAFLLASTGLLNGKKCSTHWGFTNEFREMFPRWMYKTEVLLRKKAASIQAVAPTLTGTCCCIWWRNILTGKQPFLPPNILPLI